MTCLDRVKSIVGGQLRISVADLNIRADWREDLRADSLDRVVVAVDLETALKIRITDDELENIFTVEDLVKLCDRKLGAPANDR